MSTADARASLDQLPPEVDGVPVRETLRALFSNPIHGTPDNISKAGCLALALKSNEVGRAAGRYADFSSKTHILWNAWRDAFALTIDITKERLRNAIDFSGVDFRAHDIDFSHCHFGAHANFSRAQWADEANFMGAQWGLLGKFDGARWGNSANFSGAGWGPCADFSDARWGDKANFNGAQWDTQINFTNAQWGKEARFARARWGNNTTFFKARWGDKANFSFTRWGDSANFSHTQWCGDASFIRSNFGDDTIFTDTEFQSDIDFGGAQFGSNSDFSKAEFRKDAFFDGTQFGPNIRFSQARFHARSYFFALTWEQVEDFGHAEAESFESAKERAARLNVAPDCFHQVDFRGAQFLGIPAPNGVSLVDFSGRRFLGRTLFCSDGQEPAIFNSVPKMHNCQIYPDTRIVDATFPKVTGNEDAIGAYRSLRCAFKRNQAFREEQFFFRLEMEEESLRKTGLEGWLFAQYKRFSNYGFSVGRPLFGLILLPLPLFAVLYLWFATMANPDWSLAAITSDTLWHQWLRWWLTAALPVPGTDLARELRTEIFGTGGVASLALLLEMIQKTLSLAGLFFAGLALRNLFKLK